MGGEGGGGGGSDAFEQEMELFGPSVNPDDESLQAFSGRDNTLEQGIGPQVSASSPFSTGVQTGVAPDVANEPVAAKEETGPTAVQQGKNIIKAFSTDTVKKAATAGSILGPVGTVLSAVGAGLFDIGTQQMKDNNITGADLRASEAEAAAQGAGEESTGNGSVRRRATRVAQSAQDKIGSSIVQKEVPKGPAETEEEEKAKRRKGRASTRVTGRLGLQGPVNVSRRSITRLGR